MKDNEKTTKQHFFSILYEARFINNEWSVVK